MSTESRTIQVAVLKLMITGKSFKNLQKGIRKLAHVQAWKVLNLERNIWPWLPGPARVQQTVSYLFLGFILFMMMPCFICLMIKPI